MSRVVWISLLLGMIWLQVGCAGSGYTPPASPLAKLSYDGRVPMLYVGDEAAQVSPYDRRYTTLLDGEARTLAEQSHKDRLSGTLVGLLSTGAAIATLVLAFKEPQDAFDLDTSYGKATLGLAIGSATVGLVTGFFKKRSEARLHRAINEYNERALSRAAVAPVAAAASAGGSGRAQAGP